MVQEAGVKPVARVGLEQLLTAIVPMSSKNFSLHMSDYSMREFIHV